MTSEQPPGSRIDLDLLRRVRDHIVEQTIETLSVRSAASYPDYCFGLEQNRAGNWNQRTWRSVTMNGDRCETAFCFAGWTVELTGGRWMLTERQVLNLYSPKNVESIPEEVYADAVEVASDDPSEDIITTGHGIQYVSAFNRAKRKLGLTFDEARQLFDGCNSLSDLLALIERFTVQEQIRRAVAAR